MSATTAPDISLPATGEQQVNLASVITSYSIHYTKLYELYVVAITVFPAVLFGGRRNYGAGHGAGQSR